MPRWALIATLSLSVNAVGWGLFGRLLTQGIAPTAAPPMELSLAPSAPSPIPPEKRELQPPEPPRVAPPPLQVCQTLAIAPAAPRLARRPRPIDPPEPAARPEPPRAHEEPAREEPRPLPPAATAALPITAQGDRPAARVDRDGPPALGEPSGPAARPASLREEPSVDREAVARRIHAAIMRHRQYPRMARRRGLEGTVLLSFQVTRAGALAEVRVVRSAGALLDDAAMVALRRAAPLPYAPGTIRVPVVFTLED